ncbi:hypothetical protein ACVJBD_000866 [Rhizobium mongolense]
MVLSAENGGSHRAVRFKPKSYFTLRIDEDEISGDRFPGPLACTSAGETDQISCNGDGVMLSYVSSNGEYILTMFGKGPVVLETGQYSWLANGCVRQVLQNWRS